MEHFTIKTLAQAVVPAYVFPALMSGVPGWLLGDLVLMQASYTFIAIPSAVAALLCFVLLWQMEKAQMFPVNKFARTSLLVAITLLLALVVISWASLQAQTFNIILSSFIGATVATWRQPILKQEKYS